MLVLSRKQEEEIIIAGSVVVKVLEICGDKVRLGFSAPENVNIVRRELLLNLKTTPATLHEDTARGLERPTT
jgi:carbon storage regulator